MKFHRLQQLCAIHEHYAKRGGFMKCFQSGRLDRFRLNNRSGLSLLEVALSMIVAVVLVAGLIFLYTHVDNARKTRSLHNLLLEAVSAMRSARGVNGSYAGLNQHVLFRSGNLPSAEEQGTQIFHSYNFPIEIRATDASGVSGTTTHFAVIFVDIPATACNSLIRSPLGVEAVTVRTWAGEVLERPGYSNIGVICSSGSSYKDLYLIFQ